jgi:hypothetical protein
MPWILKGQKLYCAISGREIHQNDYVVVIPAFDVDPKDPDSIFSDNVALRDEFEKWDLKDRIIARSQKRWVQWYRDSASYKILIDAENFLIMKSLIEDRITLTFLKHVFGIATSLALWEELCKQIIVFDKSEFRVSKTMRISWEVGESLSSVILISEIEDGSRDRIKVPVLEWKQLKEYLSRDSIIHPYD